MYQCMNEMDKLEEYENISLVITLSDMSNNMNHIIHDEDWVWVAGFDQRLEMNGGGTVSIISFYMPRFIVLSP